MTKLHVLHNHRRPHPPRRPAPRPPAPPSRAPFDFPADAPPTLVLPSVTVWLQTGLAAQGADGIVSFMAPILEAANQQLAEWFGIPALSGFNCVIADVGGQNDGNSGAYHAECSSQDLYCDASLNPFNAALTTALYFAEAIEVYEAAQNKGWNCGQSPGEAVSRVLAEVLISQAGAAGTLNGYATAPGWLDGPRQDFITTPDPTDTNPDANGCGCLFLYWLKSLGHDWDAIVQAGGATFADTYAALGGQGDAWEAFAAAVESKWPAGTPSGITDDSGGWG